MSSMPDKAEQPNDAANKAIGPDVDIPGPYPTAHGDTGEQHSRDPEPTTATRGTESLGDLTEEVSTSKTREQTGGLGTPSYPDEGGDK